MASSVVSLQLVGRRVLTLSSRSLGASLGRIDAYSPRTAHSRDVQVCVPPPLLMWLFTGHLRTRDDEL